MVKSAAILGLLVLLTTIGAACTQAEPAATLPSQIAFLSDRDGQYQIYVVDADGSNETRLTNSPNGIEFFSWSADSTKIMFWSDGLYVMNADGSNQALVTTTIYHPPCLFCHLTIARLCSRERRV